MSHPFLAGFELVLASQSPRRKQLLSAAGFPFRVRPANIPEVIAPGETPTEYVIRLAAQKARAVILDSHEGVLAADTTVVIEDANSFHVLEKPVDAADARRMLSLLSGRSHLVHTAVHFRWRSRDWSAIETSEVDFAPLTGTEIDTYVATGEPFDKAGAYGIQGFASRFVRGIRGCYFNIVGLPVHRVYRLFAEARVLRRDESHAPAS
ncbi:MAG: Maf family protein [Bryobacter sp.]|jgi:septum formation protein|nr:Maf family protein [Bryobacter sp. CoA8 C33]